MRAAYHDQQGEVCAPDHRRQSLTTRAQSRRGWESIWPKLLMLSSETTTGLRIVGYHRVVWWQWLPT